MSTEKILQELKTNPLQHTFSLKRENVDAENRTVELSFSSEAPIHHWFGKLILDHSSKSADLTRINTAGPLLYAHDRSKKIGVVEKAEIANDKKGRAVVRFSRKECAEEIFQDVIDGIEQTVSFGFEIRDLQPEVGQDGKQLEEDGDLVYRSYDWCPFEISIEPIAADLSVGIGRNKTVETENFITKPLVREEEKMENANLNNEPTATVPAVVSQPAQVVRSVDAEREYIETGELYGFGDLAREFSLAGKPLAELKAEIQKRRSEGQQMTIQQKPIVSLSNKEREQYSVARAILADANTRDGQNDNCLELEVSAEARKQALRSIPNYEDKGGILIPTGLALRGSLNRAGLDTKTSTAGQEAVFTEPGSFIDMLRNKAMVLQLGATILAGLVGNVAFPRQTGAGTFSWVGENPGSDVGESNLTLDQVTLSPKTGQSTTSYSRQLLAQANIAIDALVQADLVKISALAVDRAALHGTGSSNQPQGLYAASGVNAVAFGGVITLAKVIDMETEIALDNADVATMAYLTTVGARGKAKKTEEFATTNGQPLWRNGELNGYRAEATNQMSSTMLISAATGGSEHGIIFGDWSQLLFGEWGAMEIITDPYRLKKQGMIEVTNFLMIDIKPRFGNAFCKGTGQTLS